MIQQYLSCRPYFLLFLAILTQIGQLPLCAQSQVQSMIHVFVVTQDDPDISSPKDKLSMQTFTTMLSDQMGVPVSVKFVDAASASKEYIEQMFREANIRSDDAVWYYYSGHVSIYDRWPQSAQQNVPLTWVHRKLKFTGARLTLATYECYNYRSPASAMSTILSHNLGIKVLFMESSGNIIAASRQSGEPSYGSNLSGGLFTNGLLDGISSNTTWEFAMAAAQNTTQSEASKLGYVQIPCYVIENSEYQNPINAPTLTIHESDTVEGIVKVVQEIFENSTKRKVVVTFEDIMRWNPGLTRINFNSFKGKEVKIDVDDPNIDEPNTKFTIPSFPWPPPQCAQHQTLIESIAPNYRTFAELDAQIRLVLDANGYSQKSYFQVPNGFALVTQLEQFNADGTSKTGDNRWADFPVQEDVKGIWDYLVSIIVPTPGYYRLFVFIVTDNEYNLASRRVSREEAESWMKEGLTRLPGKLGEKSTTTNHSLDILIYEFETPQTTKICTLKCSGAKDILTHLKKSGLGLIPFKGKK